MSRLKVAEKVKEFKSRPGKKRSDITKFIAGEKSRQEFVPPLGTYVDLVKAEPLHNNNNAWQHWFGQVFILVMQFTDQVQLKRATKLSDLPSSTVLMSFLTCLKVTLQCGRLYKSIERWFCEKRSKGIEFSYRFTGHESKKFALNAACIINLLSKIPSLPNSTLVKLHALLFIAVKLRDSSSLYSRVEISSQEIQELNISCQEYFTAIQLLLGKVSPTVWTVGHAIPYHTKQLHDELGYGLGLNTMQGREAKHQRLAGYINNTCNVRKNVRWQIVFRHEFVSLIWLPEMDPFHATPKTKIVSYVPQKVSEKDPLTCHCSLPKSKDDDGCSLCTDDIMSMIKQSVAQGKVSEALREFSNSTEI